MIWCCHADNAVPMLIDAGERSPVESVIGSSSSQDDLEMRPARQSVRQVGGTEAGRPVSRPPTSMREFNNIPTTSAPPQTQTASIHNQFALLTSAPAAKHANAVSANTMSARHNSSYSLSGLSLFRPEGQHQLLQHPLLLPPQQTNQSSR